MATTSEVIVELARIAERIKNSRFRLGRAKNALAEEEAFLGGIPAEYADTVSEITAYAPTGAFETLAKNQLALLTTEFQALRTAASGANTALESITEF